MYLSELKLNDFSKIVSYTRNMNDFHRDIMLCFDKNREDEHVLYTLTPSFYVNGSIYVQSDNIPKENSVFSIVRYQNIEPFFNKVVPGCRFFISALLRPTYIKEHKKYQFKTREDRIKWVKRKLSENGAAVSDIEEIEMVSRNIEKQNDKFKLYGHQYRFSINVTDENKFKNLMISGLGHGKPYGFGMLMLC